MKYLKKSILNIHLGHQKFVWGHNCWLKLQITNSGKSVIEDFKIELDFEGDFEKVGAETGHYLHNPNYVNTVREYNNSNKSLYIIPKNKILVQDDYFITGNFFIKPNVNEGSEVVLKWKLLSRDFTESGNLLIKFVPKFHKVFLDNEVDNIDEVKEVLSYKLFERPGISQIGSVSYLDKETDYNFE